MSSTPAEPQGARPRLLDLFCGAGGAAMGYYRVGFDIVGVDIVPQPNYPFKFHQGDALEWLASPMDLAFYDVIHASPPCQKFTVMKHAHNAREHEDLLTPTREALKGIGVPYVIENVVGAPMPSAARPCGTSFGLGIQEPRMELRRHRYFEANFLLWGSECRHRLPTVGLYGDHIRDRRRVSGSKDRGRDIAVNEADRLRLGREALGMPWAKRWEELKEAIPPAYTEFIGGQLIEQLRRVAS